MVERVLFWGQDAPPRAITCVASGKPVDGVSFEYDAAAKTLTVRQPRVSVGEEWSIELLR